MNVFIRLSIIIFSRDACECATWAFISLYSQGWPKVSLQLHRCTCSPLLSRSGGIANLSLKEKVVWFGRRRTALLRGVGLIWSRGPSCRWCHDGKPIGLLQQQDADLPHTSPLMSSSSLPFVCGAPLSLAAYSLPLAGSESVCGAVVSGGWGGWGRPAPPPTRTLRHCSTRVDRKNWEGGRGPADRPTARRTIIDQHDLRERVAEMC